MVAPTPQGPQQMPAGAGISGADGPSRAARAEALHVALDTPSNPVVSHCSQQSFVETHHPRLFRVFGTE
jgi:hypothetical protein